MGDTNAAPSNPVLAKCILVIGCSGSGKSTLAARLARQLALPYTPTDPIYWTADWRPTPAAEVQAWADAATSAEAWVLDGNFDAERDLVWRRADLAVWLDFSLATTLWRVSRRNFGWLISGEPVWGDQRMTLAKAWGGVRHSFRSHAGKKSAYPSLLAAFAHLQVVRLTSPRQAESWLAGLPLRPSTPFPARARIRPPRGQ